MKTTALVFPCGSEIGLEICRSLRFSAHISLVGASSVGSNHGPYVYRRYVDGLPFVDSPDFVRCLNEVIDAHGVEYLFPAHDSVVLKFAEASSQLHATPVGSGIEMASVCRSKRATYAMFTDRLRVPVIPSGGMDSRARAYAVATYRPTVVAATPSFALFLGGVLQQSGQDPSASGVRMIIALGEPCPDATRARIRELWGNVAIEEFYGCTEAAPSCGGYTCGHALHFMEDTHLVETVDPLTREPTPPGTPGLVVITNLCSEASPQVRFLVGDFTTLSTSACPCGRTHVHCQGFDGRADDMLNVRGVTVFPSAVEDMLRRLPELGDEFQIVLESTERGDERFTLVVELRPGADGEAVTTRILDETRARFDLRPDVELVPYGSLPKTEFKARRVRDQRRRA